MLTKILARIDRLTADIDDLSQVIEQLLARTRTDDSLIAADSSSFSALFFSRVRSPVRSRWYRVCSRITRNSGSATKQAVTAPRSKHAASHRESAGSR